MAKIESNDLNLRDILKDELYYQIPIYQRPYQWTEENCEKLLDDLFFNYEDDRESDYFCGSLVLILISEDPKKAKTYDIVDGQQRLSTFILLAKVLSALYSERLTEESKDYLQESLITKYGKKDRLNFSAVGFNSKKDFQYALTSFNDASINNNKNNYLKNGIFKLNLIYKTITLLLYQKSTKLILKNALFSIKAHILFSIFPLSFLSFLKALITT